MHKITKGLKKKKKGKKSKHKEEELFTQEELEAYKREHQQHPVTEAAEVDQTASVADNEEWKKFSALTAGVDSILNKTKGDLDRIKSTSFFQRIPPPSEVKRQEQEQQQREEEQKHQPTEEERALAAAEAAIIPVSESESEYEDEDDIFDTAYIDALAASEVKLAYIPESPTEQQEGDDPFDTTYAERAILGPAVERKGKKLVPIGAAVEVLTGRVQAPTCLQTKRPTSRRQVVRDLLLEESSVVLQSEVPLEDSPPKLTLLDDEAPPISEPIDLSKSLAPVTPIAPLEQSAEKGKQDILKEFDVIAGNDEDDDEFAALAVESLSKAPVQVLTPLEKAPEIQQDWKPFGESEPTEDLDDPFDTTFAENILPGKAELKLIESEILTAEDDFNPRALDQTPTRVRIHITNPGGERESVTSIDRISESELNLIKPIHRDLLGGSITDLSNLGDQPLKPSEKPDDSYIEYSDPFDTSIVDVVTAPGQTELKFLEKELLSDISKKVDEFATLLNDDEFDPRADDAKITKLDFLNQQRKVSFDLPLSEVKPDLLTTGDLDHKANKPLTPYYAKDIVIPDHLEEDSGVDPFDTAFVEDLGPGKAELKVIEREFAQIGITHSLSDPDFDPRDEKQVIVAKVVETIKNITEPKKEAPKQIDLLAIDNEVSAKVLTPAAEFSPKFGEDELLYSDPFDTSIAANILPGKTELKLLESELIKPESLFEDPDFDPRGEETLRDKLKSEILAKAKPKQVQDLLENLVDGVDVRPLTPVLGNASSVDFDLDQEDIDPFDTSIANNIGPGRTELKLLESELI